MKLLEFKNIILLSNILNIITLAQLDEFISKNARQGETITDTLTRKVMEAQNAKH